MHTVPLHHQGLELRLWQPCDASALVEAAQESIDTVGRWMDDWCTPAFNNDSATNWSAHCKMHADMGMAYEFGLFCAESGRLLGGAGLNRIDTVNRLCNLGYWVRQSA